MGGGGRSSTRPGAGGRPVTAEARIESVSVTVEGDMTFGTFGLRTGTATDRCLLTTPPASASAGTGVLTLAPPLGEDEVTTIGTATAVHREEAFGKRNLCVRLPEAKPGETPKRIPIGLYEATVSVAPPGGGRDVVRMGLAGEIRRSGGAGRSGAPDDVGKLRPADRDRQSERSDGALRVRLVRAGEGRDGDADRRGRRGFRQRSLHGRPPLAGRAVRRGKRCALLDSAPAVCP